MRITNFEILDDNNIIYNEKKNSLKPFLSIFELFSLQLFTD